MANETKLIISKLTIGELITNADDLHKAVLAKLATYNVDDYKGDEKQAAKDRAELNGAKKLLNDERIRIEREFMAPFAPFKAKVADIVADIDKATKALDAMVKAKEARDKAEKAAACREQWDRLCASRKFTLVDYERAASIIGAKWGNKTYSLNSVGTDIVDFIEKTNADLDALATHGEYADRAREIYLSTLDLQSTLMQVARLKENAARLAEQQAAQEAERKARAEQEAQLAQAQSASAEVDPAVTEHVPAEQVVVADPAPSPAPAKTHRFVVLANDNDTLKTVMLCAFGGAGMRQADLACVFEGTQGEIEIFKAELANAGIGYTKGLTVTLQV